MVNEIEQVVTQFERGALNRRQLISSLLLLAAPAAAGAQPATAVCPGQTVNHSHLYIADLQRSIKFYSDLLGATVRDTSPGNATLLLPGKAGWISLTVTKEKPYINHVAYGVNFDSAKRIATDINALYPGSKARETGATIQGANTRSVYLYDPDGLYLQIVPKEDDGWLPTGPVGSRILKGEKL